MIPIAVPYIPDAAIDEVGEVLRSGRLSAGPRVAAFETAFASQVGCRWGIATANGTTALVAALYGVGVRPGDRVITSPFTFIATVNSILALGADPVFCDVEMDSGNMQADLLAHLVEDVNPKAVLAVHLYGNPMKLRSLRDLCRAHGVGLVEDCAQAHGAATDAGPAGSVGDAAAFSFYATKNLAVGEGGMVTTNNPDIAERCALFVNHGSSTRYHHVAFGLNFRMMEIQGAMGLHALAALEEGNRQRTLNAHFLLDAIGTRVPVVNTPDSVFHQFTLCIDRRADLINWLTIQGVGHGIYYPTIVPDQPVFAGQFRGNYPNARRLAEQVLSVPVHPRLSEAERERVADSLRSFLG